MSHFNDPLYPTQSTRYCIAQIYSESESVKNKEGGDYLNNQQHIKQNIILIMYIHQINY